MANQNGKQQCKIGMVGLGVMGRNMLLNMADNGFTVAGYDTDTSKVESLRTESKEKNVYGASNITDFIDLLAKPRAVMILVPAGKAVDSVISDLLPHLQPGDLIIDAGNSHFTDTNIRAEYLQKKNIQFLGVGVSGGEEGARHGPSMMPGGAKDAYEKVRVILEAVSAKANGDPCVTYLGTGSAGHYVKMVHNGIEYGIMQLIAETYDLMKRGLGLNEAELGEVYQSWNKSDLNGYLMEITGQIFTKKDDKTSKYLIDVILDVAKQNGTGLWTSESSMELQVPTTVIDVAVSMRDMSTLVKQRDQASGIYNVPIQKPNIDKKEFQNQLQSALLIGMIIAYAQGMALLSVASEKYSYQFNLEDVARIWRGGCIIRAKLLEDMAAAFHANRNLPNLLLDSNFAKKITMHAPALRKVVCHASMLGVPAPALMASLSYVDAYRSAWCPANLIQAQRDYFGAHTYERIDAKGKFHTEWESKS